MTLEVPDFMLAESGEQTDIDKYVDSPDHAFQRKLDGTRCMAVIDGSIDNPKVYLIGRGVKKGGRDIGLTIETTHGERTLYNHQFPEIVTALVKVAKSCSGRLVLDGELVVFDEYGNADFSRIQRRMNRVDGVEQASKEHPAVFRIFDILVVWGVNQLAQRLRERYVTGGYGLVTGPFAKADVNSVLQFEPLVCEPARKRGLWDLVVSTRQEGVMVKNLDSRYVESRSDAWLKVKRIDTYDVVVYGWEKGTGKRTSAMAKDKHGTNIAVIDPATGEPMETFGALKCEVYSAVGAPSPGWASTDVGLVGGGFTNKALISITKKHLLPDGKVKEPFVIEVQAFGLAKEGGKMRMPQFLREREDKSPHDCTYGQFTTVKAGVSLDAVGSNPLTRAAAAKASEAVSIAASVPGVPCTAAVIRNRKPAACGELDCKRHARK